MTILPKHGHGPILDRNIVPLKYLGLMISLGYNSLLDKTIQNDVWSQVMIVHTVKPKECWNIGLHNVESYIYGLNCRWGGKRQVNEAEGFESSIGESKTL